MLAIFAAIGSAWTSDQLFGRGADTIDFARLTPARAASRTDR